MRRSTHDLQLTDNTHQQCPLQTLSCGRWLLFAQTSGRVTYNGYSTDEFVVQRTAAYVDQQDNHIAELTVSGAHLQSHALYICFQCQVAARMAPAFSNRVSGPAGRSCWAAAALDMCSNCMQVRETLDFAARCQGGGHGEPHMKHRQRAKQMSPCPSLGAEVELGGSLAVSLLCCEAIPEWDCHRGDPRAAGAGARGRHQAGPGGGRLHEGFRAPRQALQHPHQLRAAAAGPGGGFV